MRSTDIVTSERLLAHPTSARGARELLRRALAGVDQDWLERAELAVSELVTNAVVHAGSAIELRVLVRDDSVRVEVTDGNATLPASRVATPEASTGRGLQMVEWAVDRWGTDLNAGGKTVWFELGESVPESEDAAHDRAAGVITQPDLEVVLLQVPLLMHQAWQVHTSTILRDYLLARLEVDAGVLERHARASEAMALLFDQIPAPTLPTSPQELLAATAEPAVTAARVVLRVPVGAVDHFATLHQLIEDALVLARRGELLATPTQPEVIEMRRWLCEQVRNQADGAAPTAYYRGVFEVRRTVADDPRFRSLASRTEGLLAVDPDNYIVAVTRPFLDVLGYEHEGELVGHRALTIIAGRFRQAYIARSTTPQPRNRTESPGTLTTVPMARADGSEVLVRLRTEPILHDDEVVGQVGYLEPDDSA